MSQPTKAEFSQAVLDKAREFGLRVGISPADAPRRINEYRQWLADGRAGTMTYLNRSVERRADPQLILPGVKSVISVAENYFTEPLPPEIRSDPSRGIIASYAWGRDYHDVLLAKLETLADFISSLTTRNSFPNTSRDLPVADHELDSADRDRDREVAASNAGGAAKCYVDTGHILERDFGERAGLGFIGKNTMLIRPREGSYFFLGEILTTLELEPTIPDKMPSCGNCTRCLDICPTHALPTEYLLDSNLCISYLTIEYKGVIDRRLRPLMGNHIFGCDDCQECCPWNQFSKSTEESAYQGELNREAPKLIELADLEEAGFKDWFSESPVLRPKYSGFMRNVAIALGNWGNDEAVDALEKLLSLDDPLIRLHAAWGSGQCNTEKARKLLKRVEERDDKVEVQREAHDAVLAARSRPAHP